MSKKKGNVICTDECQKCVHSNMNEESINHKFHCDAKDKDYFYGQYVPCDLKETVKTRS